MSFLQVFLKNKVEKPIQRWDLLPSKLSPVIGKAYTMLRSAASKFFIASQQNIYKSSYSAEMDRPQICRRAAQGNRPGSWFLFGTWIRDRSVFMPKNKRSVNNAEIWCFYIFHRLALKYGKADTMLRWSASKFFIASRQNVEKCRQCWDQLLPNLSLGRARDIGKIIVFQGKRIDFRITGILENLWFSTKK